MASFKKSGKGWQVQIAIKGVRESRTFSTKAEAISWAGLRETEIRHEASTGISKDKTVGDAFRHYAKEISLHKKGHMWESTRLAWLAEQTIHNVKMKDIKLSAITPASLGAWRDKRLEEDKVAGSTINRDLNLLSHVFSTAKKEWKWITESPTSGVRRPKNPASRDRLLSQDEIDRISYALGFDESPAITKTQRIAVAFLFAIESAMRAGEICGLMPGDVVGRRPG